MGNQVAALFRGEIDGKTLASKAQISWVIRWKSLVKISWSSFMAMIFMAIVIKITGLMAITWSIPNFGTKPYRKMKDLPTFPLWV